MSVRFLQWYSRYYGYIIAPLTGGGGTDWTPRTGRYSIVWGGVVWRDVIHMLCYVGTVGR